MNNNISKEQKLSKILELLIELDGQVFSIDFEDGMLNLYAYLEDDDAQEHESCPCFDPDEDDEDEEQEHCIHCCPECGTCMLGLGGEDC